MGRCLRRFRLSPLTTLLEFVACLFCPVELDFLNLVIYWQGGTAIAAESHFPIHVDFKPSAAAWAGKVDDLHENPFRITSERVRKDGGHLGCYRFPVCYDHHTQLKVDECPDHSTSATKRSKYGVDE